MKQPRSVGFYLMFVLVSAGLLVLSISIGVVFLFGFFRAGLIAPEQESPLPFIALVWLPSIIVGTLIAAVVGRWAIRPLVELSTGMRQVASGDFGVSLSERGWGQFGEVRRDFNTMVRQLASIEMLSSDFIANVSHEFRSPLAAISGYATLLQEPGLGEAERRDYLDIIMSATRSLDSLTSNILAISNLEAQSVQLEYQRFSLAEQLRQVLALLAAVAVF